MYSSRATRSTATNADQSHHGKRTTRTISDLDFALLDEENDLGLVPMFNTTVVSRQSSCVTGGDGQSVEHDRDSTSDSAMGGILRTQVVTVSFMDKDCIPSGA